VPANGTLGGYVTWLFHTNMFEYIRTHRRAMLVLLLVLVVPAFAFFGLEGYTGFMSRDRTLAEVNGAPITQPEFDSVRRNQLEELRVAMGSQFDIEAIDTPAFRQSVLDDIIDQRVIVETAMRGRFSVSDEQLRETIARIPAVQQDGRFSAQLYRQILASQGMTPADFEARVRSDLILSQVLGPIGATSSVPQRVVDDLLVALTQERTVSIRRFNAVAFEDDIEVTDDEIATWYQENSESLRLPDSVNIQYVVLDEQAASEGLSVPQAEIEAFYQQNQSRYGQPEQRRVSHILIEVAPDADEQARAQALARAQTIAQDLQADPSAFAQTARELSEDPGSANQGGDLGWIARDTLVPEVEEAVFVLDPETVSDVIESPFGYHVAVVTDVRPSGVKPLDEVRDDIEQEVLRQMASVRFADMATELTNRVYDERDALAPIAVELGLPLRQAQGLSRSGLLPSELFARDVPIDPSQQQILNNPRVLQIAYSPEVFRDRYNSGVIEVSPGTIVVLRVDEVIPAAVPPLAQVEDLIRQDLLAQGALSLARQAGQAALSVIDDAQQSPIGFSAAEVVSRQDGRSLTATELDAVMKLAQDQVPRVIGVDTRAGYTLLHIQEVLPGEPLPEQAVEQFKGQLAQAWGVAQEQAVLQVLRREFNVEITPAAQALIQNND
jgi:peptidyl-prolyl cis-trans isomerase D